VVSRLRIAGYRPSSAGRVDLARWAFAGAVAAAVVGSFSSLQGLLIWPSELFVLWIRSRTKGLLLAWIVAATLTIAIFFYNFQFQHGDLSYVLRQPVDSVAFYFFLIGDVVGFQAPGGGQAGNLAVVALGVAIAGVAVWTVTRYGIRPNLTDPSALGVTIILFGLMCAGLITIGRAPYGPSVALRYAVFTLLGLGGLLLGPPEPSHRTRLQVESSGVSVGHANHCCHRHLPPGHLGNGVGHQGPPKLASDGHRCGTSDSEHLYGLRSTRGQRPVPESVRHR
jgi:hypothetical protein